MNRKTVGTWLVAAALGLVLLAGAANAQIVPGPEVVTANGSQTDGARATPPAPPAPKTPPPTSAPAPQDSSTMGALQARIAQLSGENSSLDSQITALRAKFDGGQKGAPATDATSAGGSVPSSRTPPAIAPKAGDTVKGNKNGFASNAASTAGNVGAALPGVGIALGGIAIIGAFAAMMFGAAPLAMGLLIGGIATICLGCLLGVVLGGKDGGKK